MKLTRLFACVVGVAALAVVVAPIAQANCSGPKVFQSTGNAMAGEVQLRFSPPANDVSLVQFTPDSVVGRFWQADDAGGANNFDDNCPALTAEGGWWNINMALTGFSVDGAMTATGCAHNGCPAGQVVVLVEDLGTADEFNGGPDGVPDTAFYAALSVDETPADIRNFNYARVNNLAGGIEETFLEFPSVDVTSSGREGMAVTVTLDLRDAGLNFLGTDNAANTPILASTTIESYNLMKAQAMTDPGRDRSNWTMIDTIEYQDAGVTGQFESVACDDTTSDAWLSVGITFVGGVESVYVGEAVALQCDPALADPQGRQLIDRESPSNRKSVDKPTRSRGSRGR